MNQGLDYLNNFKWVLFWGSDDWATNNKALENMITYIEKDFENKDSKIPDLVFFNGIYIKRNSELEVELLDLNHLKFL